MTAYERRELELQRSIIEDAETKIRALEARLQNARNEHTTVTAAKQNLLEDKDKVCSTAFVPGCRDAIC